MKELITRLSNLSRVSGREHNATVALKEELEGVADSVKTDKFGNVVAKRKGTSDFSIMLSAHIDEIGLIVEKIDEEKFAYPARAGGWDPRILPSKPMKSKDGWGTVNVAPTQLSDNEGEEKAVKFEDLFMEGNNLCQGDFLVQDVETVELGNDNLLVGKSLDNAAGMAVLIKTFEKLEEKTEANIYGVGTTQEEFHHRGAEITAFRLNPDLAIILETSLADDFPMGHPYTPVVELGEGPTITIKDADLISHPGMNQFLIEVAEEEGIPYQLEIQDRGGTEAGTIYKSQGGVPASVIGTPTRYLHSPVEVLDVRDLEEEVNLISSVIYNLTKPKLEFVFSQTNT